MGNLSAHHRVSSLGTLGENVTRKERLEDAWETIRVKWFMMDAQQKYVLLMMIVSVYTALLDALGQYLKNRYLLKGQDNNHE